MRSALAHTAAPVASQEGPEAVLALSRSAQARWLGAVTLAALLGLLAISVLPGAFGGPTVLQESGGALLLGALGALIAVMGVGALAGRSQARVLSALSAWILFVALVLAGAEALWTGAALVGGAGLVVGELVALLVGRVRQDAAPSTWAHLLVLLPPAALASLVVYLVPPSTVDAAGAAAGGVLATLLLGHARLGDHAAPHRHASSDVWPATLTKAVEAGRTVLLWLLDDPDVDHAPPRDVPNTRVENGSVASSKVRA